MYLIPKDFDFNKLTGINIGQICFTKNNVSLVLDNVGYITIEGRFTIVNDNGYKEDFEIYPVTSDLGLLRLLEQEIVQTSTNEIRTDLIVKFSEGYVLTLVGDENYESYAIKLGEILIRI